MRTRCALTVQSAPPRASVPRSSDCFAARCRGWHRSMLAILPKGGCGPGPQPVGLGSLRAATRQSDELPVRWCVATGGEEASRCVCRSFRSGFSVGCSALAQISLDGPPRLDPNKVYLGTSRVIVHGSDLDRYACVNGPMMCDNFAASLRLPVPESVLTRRAENAGPEGPGTGAVSASDRASRPQ